MKVGRKKVYDETFPLLAEKHGRNGLNDKQIAKKLNISVGTFYEYLKEFPEFSDAVKRGKRKVDIEVENALLKRALGFEFMEVTTEADIVDNKPVATKTKQTKKYFPPDVGAAMNWLKNRLPDEWREKTEIDHTTAGNPLPAAPPVIHVYTSGIPLANNEDEIEK